MERLLCVKSSSILSNNRLLLSSDSCCLCSSLLVSVAVSSDSLTCQPKRRSILVLNVLVPYQSCALATDIFHFSLCTHVLVLVTATCHFYSSTSISSDFLLIGMGKIECYVYVIVTCWFSVHYLKSSLTSTYSLQYI